MKVKKAKNANAAFEQSLATPQKQVYVLQLYVTGMTPRSTQAIANAKSTDTAAVRAALSGLKTATIVGDVEMRAADHQILRSMVITRAIKVAEGKGDFAVREIQAMSKVAPPVGSDCKK